LGEIEFSQLNKFSGGLPVVKGESAQVFPIGRKDS